ncbi:hypothetical protein LL264_04740 [Lactococcus lactis]|nr:hypothetical protein [Lactococcus lactis]
MAGFTIQDLIPAFLQALGGAIDFVNGVIEALKPAFKFFWDNFLKPVAEWTGGVIVDVLKGLGDVLSTIGDWLSEHGKGFSDFVITLGTFAGVVGGIIAVGTAIETFVGFLGGLAAIITGAGGVTGAIGSLVAILGGPITIVKVLFILHPETKQALQCNHLFLIFLLHGKLRGKGEVMKMTD